MRNKILFVLTFALLLGGTALAQKHTSAEYEALLSGNNQKAGRKRLAEASRAFMQSEWERLKAQNERFQRDTIEGLENLKALQKKRPDSIERQVEYYRSKAKALNKDIQSKRNDSVEKERLLASDDLLKEAKKTSAGTLPNSAREYEAMKTKHGELQEDNLEAEHELQKLSEDTAKKRAVFDHNARLSEKLAGAYLKELRQKVADEDFKEKPLNELLKKNDSLHKRLLPFSQELYEIDQAAKAFSVFGSFLTEARNYLKTSAFDPTRNRQILGPVLNKPIPGAFTDGQRNKINGFRRLLQDYCAENNIIADTLEVVQRLAQQKRYPEASAKVAELLNMPDPDYEVFLLQSLKTVAAVLHKRGNLSVAIKIKNQPCPEGNPVEQ